MTTHAPALFESVEELSDGCRTALRNLLLALADTKLLLGYHYGEWTFGAPALEAAIANCSLAQTELGHVRLLHGVLKSHFGDDPDWVIDLRPGAEFASVTYLDGNIPDWPAVVAASYAVDLAATRMLYALKGSAFKPLHMSVAKMLEEERYHIHHGQGWFRTLARRGDDARAAIEERLRAALASVAEWLGPPDEAEDRLLVAAGIKSESNDAVLRALLDDIRRTAEPLGVRSDVAPPGSFDGWNPRTRRRTRTGPDEEILQHLRGSKNTIFKLGS